MTTTYNRISARKGAPVRLNMTFFSNGVASDPFAIRRVSIYRNAVAEENLIAQYDIGDPSSTDYPTPIVRDATGQFHLDWDVPDDIEADSYIDVGQYLRSFLRHQLEHMVWR
jgi:hypothetical protein